MLLRFPHILAGAAALGAASLVANAASASPDQDITTSEGLDGTHSYNHFTVKSGATLTVTSLFSMKGSGKLVIKANVITIESGAIIDANGAGNFGVDGDDGGSATGSNGGGVKGSTHGFPGGGGGFFAAGDPGTTEATAGMCMDSGGSPGGAAFAAMLKMAELGSAGGAANVMPITATKGGAGGGAIVLAAEKIVIDGIVRANGGTPPFAPGGVGPGGGSGGTIQITAVDLSGKGTVSAIGGDGIHGAGSPNPADTIIANNGGGGGSGLILLQLPSGASTGSITFQMQNGKTGDCTTAPMTFTPVKDPLPGNCIDVDGDGEQSSACGGTDCDDADTTINTKGKESCDGQDNDCNGKTDDGNLCAAGSECKNGACVAIADAGSPDAGPAVDAGATPDHVEFGGGCDLFPGLPAEGGAATALALGALALSRARTRRRR